MEEEIGQVYIKNANNYSDWGFAKMAKFEVNIWQIFKL
jgi:hypothetical protein